MCEHIANELARRRRVEILYEGKACARCGETNAEMLGHYSRIDFHHLIGRENESEFGVYYCHNCHALAKAQQKQVGIVDLSPKPQRNLLEVVMFLLRAIGHTLKDWGERLSEYADKLADLIESLDESDPSWRELPEAQL